MLSIKKTLSRLGLDDWVLGITGLVAVAIGTLDFLNWIKLTTDQLLQITVVSLGLIMATIVIQASRQGVDRSELQNELEKIIVGDSDVRRFSKAEYGFEYMAKKVRSAKKYIDHASLSPAIPRWYSTVPDFERAIQDTAIASKIKIRYIANFADKARLKRVSTLLSHPKVNRYFVASFGSESLKVHMMNFMIIDDEELIFGIHGFGGEDTILAIKNEQIVLAFEQYFDLLWSNGTPVSRESLAHDNLSNNLS